MKVSPAQSDASIGRTRSIWIWTTVACFLSALFFFFWRGPMPLEGILRILAAHDAWTDGPALATNERLLRIYYAHGLGLALLAVACISAAGFIWSRLDERLQNLLFEIAFTCAVTCAMLIYMFRMETEGPWMPLDDLINHPSMLPVFGHRLLFVEVAKAFQKIDPGLSNLRSYYLSQAIAIALAIFALGRWSALFVGRSLSWVGQVLGAVLISTCFTYYTFYDVGTVFFTTCALYAIYTRRYWWLVPIVLIGTFNYEGVVLLIATAAFVAYGEPIRNWIYPIAVSFAIYWLDRSVLQWLVPLKGQFQWRVWSNITFPFIFPRQLAFAFLIAAGWMVVGLMSIRYCNLRVKKLLVLFPLMFATSFIFGKLNEPRLFDGFVPVFIAVILTASLKRRENEQSAPVNALQA